jgi:hypothetical protein
VKQHDSVRTTRGHARHSTVTTHENSARGQRESARDHEHITREQHADSATTCDNR